MHTGYTIQNCGNVVHDRTESHAWDKIELSTMLFRRQYILPLSFPSSHHSPNQYHCTSFEVIPYAFSCHVHSS